jgi:alkyl sulfatase BDS1-like metallo-beta-lactamase superfamily hydrolase
MGDLDFTDTTDFEDVERGFVGTLDDPVITAADGHVSGIVPSTTLFRVTPPARRTRVCGGRGS